MLQAFLRVLLVFLVRLLPSRSRHQEMQQRLRFFSQILLSLGLASVSCAPVGSTTKESKQVPAGVLEGYSVVVHLAPTGSQAAANNGTTTTQSSASPASSTKPSSTLNLLNTTSQATGAAAAHPPLKYCFEIPAGSTVSAQENKYNCRFLEYITGADGKDQMKKRVWEPDPSNPNAPKGIPATCQFGANLQSLVLGCEYRVIDNGKETSYPCSSYKDNVSVGGKLAQFVQIKSNAGNFNLEALPQSGNSDAGTPLPTVSFSGMVKGSCAKGEGASIGFPVPELGQLVDSPDGQPTSNPSASANPSTGNGAKVNFTLNTTTVKGKTALKTSSAQSDPSIAGDSPTQCTIKEVEAGTTAIVASLMTGKTAPDEESNHYVVAGLESVKVNGQEACPEFIKATTAKKSKIYLFKDHWTKN